MAESDDKQAGSQAGSLYRYQHWLAATTVAVLCYAVFGFLAAPWLIETQAVEYVRENYDSELRIENVAVNPFTLTLAIDGLVLDDPAGQTLARIRQLFVNLQASSLFRRAVTLAEFRIHKPELMLERDASGALNVAYLFEAGTHEPMPNDAEPSDEGLPRILVFDFAIVQSSVHWEDRVPSESVTTTFGPVDIRVQQLSTLPQQSGQQTVVVTTESSGTLSWTGELQLSPLYSSGSAAISGSHFGLVSRYLKQQSGFNILEGESGVGFDYEISVDEAGEFVASVTNLQLTITDLLLHKTDPGAPLTATDDRQVLAMPLLALRDGSVKWPEREARFRELVMEDADLAIYRDSEERINWISGATDETNAEPVEETAGEGDWAVFLDKLDVRSLVVGLEDHSVSPAADIGLASLDLVVTDLSNQAESRFPTRMQMVTRAGGAVSVEGQIVALPEFAADVEVEGKGISLAELHPYIQPLADVRLDSGALSMNATVTANSEETLAVRGDFGIENFLVTETDEGSRLGSWDRLDISNLDLSVSGNTLNISELRFRKSYADIFIAQDGTVNLGRVEKGEQGPERAEGGDQDSPDSVDEPGDDESAFDVLIGRVIFDDAGADFADESLPLPFSARIAELSGEISTIATASLEPSEVALEGKVDEHGFVSVSGSVTPLDPALNTDLDVAFRNVEMPKFSAYSIPFAGREIANGRLDLDLGYQVTESRLEGENRIVLHDFELGDKVEHPGAMSLPLGLAVALLKDPSGKIDIDLPVRGDLNDPEFRYGGVILKALGNLIVKIVASPFALLGNLLGVEADELSQVNFIAGRADLTPPEEERAAKLAEALALRPQLVLELPGAVDRKADGEALAAARVDALVEAHIGERSEDAGEEMYATQKLEALEAIYTETVMSAGDAETLDDLRLQFTTTPTDEDGQAGEPVFDSVAFTAELRRALITRQDVPEEELVELANARAAAVREAVVAADPELVARIVIVQPQAAERGEEETIPMKVTLGADGAEAEPAEPEEGTGLD